MLIHEFLTAIDTFNGANITRGWTVDGIKFGSGEKSLTTVAVAMFPTLEIMEQAVACGAELLLVHEPSFQNDKETVDDADCVHHAKKDFLERTGLTVARFHDHPHFMPQDLIDEGTIRHSGLRGRITGMPYWAVTGFELDEPMTARQVAIALENALNTRNIRMVGAIDTPVRRIAFACGTPGHILEMAKGDAFDIIVTGEICEWAEGEYVRDAAYYGRAKALLVLGHCVSEREGMRALADMLADAYPALKFVYLETPDLYRFSNDGE